MNSNRDAVAGFGRYLLRERELRGLSREEVARRTRLAPGVVEAIESGDAERMPPRAYLLGTLRGYAAAVGLDPDEVVLRWQEAEGGEAPAAAAPRRRRGRRWIAVAAVALLAAALALLHLLDRQAAPGRERTRRAAEGGSSSRPIPAPPEAR